MTRSTSIDTAKGIGILCVMGLHCGFHQTWMATFEMPLFFILSGVFFKFDLSFRDFAIKKINTLLIPYIFFESPKLIYDLFYSFSYHISFVDSYFYSSFPSTTWFILSLFQIHLGCYFLFHSIHGKYRITIVACLISLAGYGLWLGKIPNFLFIPASVTGTGFFILGFLSRNLILRLNSHSFIFSILASTLLFILCFLVWTMNKANIFYRNNLLDDSWWAIIVMALSGTLATLLLANILDNKFFNFFGGNSLIVLGTHLYIFLLYRFIDGEVAPILIFLTGVVVEIPLIYCLRRFFPKFIGAQPMFHIQKISPKSSDCAVLHNK